MKHLFILFLSISVLVVKSQDEKRLALVIGNANYEKGALKNPVNDALLMAKTLESLDFDVILDTNIVDQRSFINKIKEFGEKRSAYNVAFVYYAGHGVQVNNVNYLLPTKEVFKSHDDVIDYAVSVQRIIKYLTKMTDQVNVLILDACRNNPFEKNWDATRSIEAGSGLAKMQATKGSLIAFSTTAGKTAPDGNGDNSIYCQVLSKNMLKEGVNLDQVFRNVRAEVDEITNGEQMTEESTQLTGQTFYLVKRTFKKEFALLDSLFDNGSYLPALEIASSILEVDAKNLEALVNKGNIYSELEKYDKALEDFNLAIELYPNNWEPYYHRAVHYHTIAESDQKTLSDLNKSIELDSNHWEPYSYIADIYFEQGNYKLANDFYTKAVLVDPGNYENYDYRADFYAVIGEVDKALEDYSKVIELLPNDPDAYCNRGDFYYDINNAKLAFKDYDNALEVDPFNARVNNNKAEIYFDQGNYDLALKELSLAIKNVPDPLYFRNRALIYEDQENYELAYADYSKAIELSPDNYTNYNYRAWFFENVGEYSQVLLDYSKSLDLNPNNPYILCERADLYDDYKNDQKMALKDNFRALEIDSAYTRAINNIALIYSDQEKYDESIAEFTKAIELSTDSIDVSLYYSNRA
ncbi:MAG: tetratricopeptide repeat protein, partial [Flavobacteriales bacterium]|nr:tetratricopeptide repeat protein [Flavobacteriales bacterium]